MQALSAEKSVIGPLCGQQLNAVQSVPTKEIFDLQYLKVLKIGGNEFETIPRGIDSLKVIEEIDLWNTSINDLPLGIESVKSLKRLDLRGILLNYEKQAEIFELLPKVQVYMSPACNCGF